MELDKVVEETVNKAMEKAIVKINKGKHKYKEDDKSENIRSKTIKLLNSYINLQRAIGEHEEDIEYIKKYGIPQKTNSIIRYSKNDGMRIEKTSEDKIGEIADMMNTTKQLLQRMELALLAIRDNEYFEIIPMTYFQKCTREEIAGYFDVEPKTITRNRNKLVDEMGIILFAEEFSTGFLNG